MNNKEILKIIPTECVEMLFNPCPFCGLIPNVFQVPEDRYAEEDPYGWVVECKDMGCIFKRSNADQSFEHLLKEWNSRKHHD